MTQVEPTPKVWIVNRGKDWDSKAFAHEKDAYTYACRLIDESLIIHIKEDDMVFDVYIGDSFELKHDYYIRTNTDAAFSKCANTVLQLARLKPDCFEKYDFYDFACRVLEKYITDEEEFVSFMDICSWPQITQLEVIQKLGKERKRI